MEKDKNKDKKGKSRGKNKNIGSKSNLRGIRKFSHAETKFHRKLTNFPKHYLF